MKVTHAYDMQVYYYASAYDLVQESFGKYTIDISMTELYMRVH